MAVTPSGPELPPPRPVPAAEVAPLPPEPASATDVAQAARVVLGVAGALGRYLFDVRSRGPLAAARHVRPLPSRLALAAVWRAARTVTTAREVVTGVAGGMADVLLPTVAREALSRVDVTALVLEFVDIDRLAAALDVDAVVARVDFDAAVDRIDVDAIAAGLDLDALVEKVDITRVLNRVDLDDVVARVDLDRAVDRVDIDRVLTRVDLDDVVARVDLDRAVDRVDLDRVIARADVLALVRWVLDEIDLPALIRSSSSSVGTELVRGVREQSADADRAVERVVDRLLRRQGRRTAAAPSPALSAAPEAGRDGD